MTGYRKKPIVVQAWQFLPAGERKEPPAWIDPRWFRDPRPPGSGRGNGPEQAPHMLIPTPEGVLRADLTDWLIRGVKGEVYPCKADVFAVTYEPAP